MPRLPAPRKIDLITAAMQSKGATALDIEEFTLMIRKLPGFPLWNIRLNKEARGWLALLTAGGAAHLADGILAGISALFAGHAGMSPEDLEQESDHLLRQRRGGHS